MVRMRGFEPPACPLGGGLSMWLQVNKQGGFKILLGKYWAGKHLAKKNAS